MDQKLPKRARRNPDNPLCYFDVTIGGSYAGKIVFELFQDAVPKVVVGPLLGKLRPLLSS